MQTKSVASFDDKEELICRTLRVLGYHRTDSRVLVCLAIHLDKELTSREIEVITKLRQPEVSIALSNPAISKYIAKREDRTISKGRPTIRYSLTVQKWEALQKEIIQNVKREISIKKTALKQVSEFV